ncbi:MAG: gamma carbonic anhydrase family protein [Chloroflexota bacterium]|nr:gamma carbonic anhydrase family protein [Chloroflexota bacterium]
MGLSQPIILPYNGIWPKIAASAFIAPGAVIIGDVEIGDEASVWFNCTVRGDIAPVRLGMRSNVQDNSVLHVNADAPCLVGDGVTIGHGAIVHGTTVGDGVMIGMGATVLSYTTIGAGAVVAAGSLVPERMTVEPGAVVMGVPAKVRSGLSAEQQDELRQIPGRYVGVSAIYRGILAEMESGTDGD